MTHRPALPPRSKDAHKGDFGRILLIAGSQGMSGAAVLAAKSCLHSGAGLLTVASPVSAQKLIAMGHPSVMTVALSETGQGRLNLDSLGWIKSSIVNFNSVAFGPGLGRSAAVDRIAGWIFRNAPCPVIMDADGLNGLAVEIALGNIPPESNREPENVDRVLTPHPGEMKRLWQAAQQVGWVQEDFAGDRAGQESQTKQLATILRSVILLKGSKTFITDGSFEAHNHTGNPGMATGGSGDCLTGILAALLPVMQSAIDATVLAARIHGLAGDLTAESMGQTAMTSNDMVSFLPQAWLREAGAAILRD